jgi:hypothetical protein
LQCILKIGLYVQGNGQHHSYICVLLTVFRKMSAAYGDSQIKPITIQHATLQNATADGMHSYHSPVNG